MHERLIQQVARRQSLFAVARVFLGALGFVGQVLDVPAVEQDATAVGVGLEGVNHIVDLVDRAAVLGRPGGPLLAVDRAQVAVFGGPFVPDAHAVFIEPFDVGVAAQHPDQLVGDAFEVQLLGGQQREAVGQVVPILASEHGLGAGAGAVALGQAIGHDVVQQFEILLHVDTRFVEAWAHRGWAQAFEFKARCSSAAAGDCTPTTAGPGRPGSSAG